MSKVVYEYELNAVLGPHHAHAVQVKLRVRAISHMIAKKMEVSRRRLYNKVVDNNLVWLFADDHTVLDEQGTATLNMMMREHYKESRVEGNIRKAAMGLPVSKWDKDRRKS